MRQVQFVFLILRQKRNDCINSLAPPSQKFILKPVAAARTGGYIQFSGP